MPYKNNYVDGDKIGELTFIRRIIKFPDKSPRAIFRCRCGKEFDCKINGAQNKSTKSCGCVSRKLAGDKNRRHEGVQYFNMIGTKLLPKFRKEDENRFWSKVDVKDNQNECWLWTAHVSNKGYGSLNVGKTQNYTSNRIAYYLHNKKDPEDWVVRHTCHTPRCCNPNHLILGTQNDNMQDMVKAGRQNKGAEVRTAKLQESDVIKIRELFKNGISIKEIKKDYPVSLTNIHAITRNQIWKHIL